MKITMSLMLLITISSYCQSINYSVSNAHSHNDYRQDMPFIKAYNAGFGSIEVDIFLKKDELLVAHDYDELDTAKTLNSLYLEPLNKLVIQNGGYPYEDTTKKLQFLIDIKSDSILTLDRLVKLLESYPHLTISRNLRFVISGNRPPADSFTSYPAFIWFDGVLGKTYSDKALQKISLMSDNLQTYTKWNGNGDLSRSDCRKLKNRIGKVHALGKPVRFWNAPDFENAWKKLEKLEVDYINTDHIPEISSFLDRAGH
jgi:alkaline phosphatase